jgi:hypothetical protein
LRTAGIIMLLHTIGHTIGALTWKKAPNPVLKQVVDGMINNHFTFMGRLASIGDFYSGYGYSMIGVLLLITILLWQLSVNIQRPFVLTLGIFLLFLSVIEYIWFFPFASAFSLVAGIATMVAYQKSKMMVRV